MNSTSSAQALAAHLIGQTLGSVALLESLSFITPSDARAIRSRLSLPAGPSPAAALLPQADLTSSFGSIDVAGVPSSSYGQPSIPSLPKRNSGFGIKARALWDYGGTVGRFAAISNMADVGSRRNPMISLLKPATP